MWQYLLSAWRSGFRGRSIQGVLIFGLLLISVAYFAAAFSPRQPKTVALDVGISGLRFSLVMFSLFWVQELVAREIERRTVMLTLTYPCPRGAYVIGRYLGIVGLLGLAAVLLGLLLWLLVLLAGGDYEQQFSVELGWPYWFTIAGLWLDAAVVAAFALCIATLSTVPMLPLALGAAFAMAGKSLGAVVDYLGKGADGQDELVAQYSPLIDVIRWVLPDLSRLDWRAWSMYNLSPGGEALALSSLMGAAYIVLMLATAVVCFSRREFG